MNEWLSKTGQQKRQEILALAHRAARSKRRRRRVGRAVAGSATLVLVAAILIRWSSLHRTSTSSGSGELFATTAEAQHRGRVVIERVYDDATITQRLALAPQPLCFEKIDDDALIGSLADAGQPAGLIRIGNDTTLVTSSAE
jgi:hypothetical protein